VLSAKGFRHKPGAPFCSGDRYGGGALVTPGEARGVFLGVKFVEYEEKIAPCFGDGPHTGCLVPGSLGARLNRLFLLALGDERGQRASL
jgi:hypothetical protein